MSNLLVGADIDFRLKCYDERLGRAHSLWEQAGRGIMGDERWEFEARVGMGITRCSRLARGMRLCGKGLTPRSWEKNGLGVCFYGAYLIVKFAILT